MISIVEKHGPFTVKRVWFNKMLDSGCTLQRLMRIDEPVDSNVAFNELSYTPISDLTMSEDKLLMGVRKTVRNEIRRAANDNLSLFFFDSDAIEKNLEIIDEFENAYQKFAKELNNGMVFAAYSRNKIDQYLKVRCFYLTEAKSGLLSVYHAYVYDEEEVVLIYSVSDFRSDSVDRNLAGRANKYLHYQDMLMFKRLGLKIYDWGNISDPDNPNGIDNFKLSFGGTIKKKYNVLIGCNLVGRIFVKYYRMKKGIISK